ncbi:MAG: serine protease [Nitrospirota bacterium]|nr:serine protease [Flavobacteriaceae bacterium]MDH5769408.1 serine protease [Nitrospirota bacterium]
MVPSNILQRTFYIRYEIYLGTGFTFERNGIQYLATTSHTFPFTEDRQELDFSIMRNNDWQVIHSKIYKHTEKSVDIVALTLSQDISPRHPINMGTNNLFLSQDAFFLGFPFGKFMEDTAYLNNGFPIPYVKKGIFSTIPFKLKNLELLYIDGINNPGFSGGPCVFIPHGQTVPSICGVVRGYLPHEIEVKTPFGNYTFEENSGLVEVHSINHLNEITF